MIIKWAASSECRTYRLCEQRRFRGACTSTQSRQNLRCSLIQAVSQEEPSDRKPDLWPLWMTGHAQLKFVMTECSKTRIRLTRPKWSFSSVLHKNMCCVKFIRHASPCYGHLLETPRRKIPTTCFLMEKYGKLSINDHQIPTCLFHGWPILNLPPRKPTKKPINSMLSPGVTKDADRNPANTNREPNIATTRYPINTEAMAAINTENRIKTFQISKIEKNGI